MEKRTREEMIQYFKHLSFEYGIIAHRNNDEVAKGKAEAYELAAFELEHNMN